MNKHTINMNSHSLIASGMSLQSDLLGPANLEDQDTPPPPPHPGEIGGVYDCCGLSSTLP